MKNSLFALLAFIVSSTLSSCGYLEVGTKGLAQIKRIHKVTPLLCPDYTLIDVSLGVMQNGAGSMSKEDIEMVVTEDQAKQLDTVLSQGKGIIEMTYSRKRVSFCKEDRVMTGFTVLDAPPVVVFRKEASVEEDKTDSVVLKKAAKTSKVYDKCVDLATSVKELDSCVKYQ